MNDFLARQPQLASRSITGRYINLESISPLLGHFAHDLLGHSVDQLPISVINMGNGPIKILMWSQMHGNESTSTKGLFDVLYFLQENPSLLSPFTLKVIPMLNPDGAALYTRTNANQIDLNRDAINLSQPESKLLVDCYHSFKPDYCFNLHDQRTIFGVGENACMLSFLSPAADEEKSMTPARTKAMGVIGHIVSAMPSRISQHIGRFDDSYNPNCMGDYFQGQETPTILFECGQVGEDYGREETRKWFGVSLLEALQCIANGLHKEKTYHHIAEVEKSFVDILLQFKKSNGQDVNIAILFQEILENREIHFIPIVHSIGELTQVNAHKHINLNKKDEKILENISLGQDFTILSKMLNLTQYSH